MPTLDELTARAVAVNRSFDERAWLARNAPAVMAVLMAAWEWDQAEVNYWRACRDLLPGSGSHRHNLRIAMEQAQADLRTAIAQLGEPPHD